MFQCTKHILGRKSTWLDSELRESITIAEIGEKVMNMPISLTFGEILAASPDLAAHFSEQARKRRRPIETTSGYTTNTANTIAAAQVNSIIRRPLYAYPSGRVKVILEDTLKVEALCDDGSEINLMPHRTFEKLNIPIDSDVDWTIDGYAAAKEAAGSNHLLGVCHETKINVGGVVVSMPVFIVEDTHADLILGKPWSLYVRVQYINEDDESYTCIIKSLDGRRIVHFVAAPAEHK
jgi:hypothetical protein